MSKIQEVGDAFAAKAAQLLKEFTQRMERERDDVVRLLEAYNKQDGPPQLRAEYLRARYENHRHDFHGSMATYNTLSRQSSQWLQHGDVSPPIKLELEVRLADFERTMQSMHMFYAQHDMR